MAIIELNDKSKSLLIDVVNFLLPYKGEIVGEWKRLCDFHSLYDREKPLDDYLQNAETYLFSLANGDFDRFYCKIEEAGTEFAIDRQAYDTLILSFHLFEESSMRYINLKFRDNLGDIVNALDHLYHNVMATLAKMYFMEIERERERFFHIMAHDLKEPINRINLACELLSENSGLASSDRGRDYFEQIFSDIYKLSDVINETVAFGRISSARSQDNYAVFDFFELAKEVVGGYAEICERKNLNMVFSGDEESHVKGDRGLLERAIVNYLSNTVKYAESSVVCCVKKGKDDIVLSVRDDGPGIEKKYLGRIFEDYFRTPGSRSGTGLGLSSVRRIVQLHQGKSWVESEKGRGSCFYLSLPRYDGD